MGKSKDFSSRELMGGILAFVHRQLLKAQNKTEAVSY